MHSEPSDNTGHTGSGRVALLGALASRLDGALIAVDFDGTLAPIVRDPSQSRPVAGVIDTLAALAQSGAQIAVVTGRDAGTVLELGGLAAIPGLVISGVHGAETWRDGELRSGDEAPGIDVLRAELPPLLPERVWLEDKRLSLVVHTRQAADPDAALDQLSTFVPDLVAAQGLETHPGKQVLEIRTPGLSKATALRELLTDDTTAAFYAGDDLGDLPAIEAVRSWAAQTGKPGVTVAVGEIAELHAQVAVAVDSPTELARLLADLLNRRDEPSAAVDA